MDFCLNEIELSKVEKVRRNNIFLEGSGIKMFLKWKIKTKPQNWDTLWWQLEDMFQLIGTSQGIERLLFQIIVTPEYFEKFRVKYKAWHKFW